MSDQTQPPAVTEQNDPLMNHLNERARELVQRAARIKAQYDVDSTATAAALSEVQDLISKLESKKRARKPRVVADQPVPDVAPGQAA